VVHASEEIIGADDPIGSTETGTKAPVILQSANPGYPMKAEENRVEGFVTVRFVVTKDGTVANPEVVESVPPGYFENATINALNKYKFGPATENGSPVDFTIEWPFLYKFPDTVFSDDIESRKQACRHLSQGISLIEKAEYEKAVKELSEAVKLESQFGTAYYYRSYAYMNMEDYESAISDADKAIELSSQVFGYYNHRGSIYLFKKDYQKAINDFNKSLSIEQRNIVAYIDRGDAYRLSEKYEDAVTDYTSALDLNDKLIHVYNNRGYTYYKLNENENACADFKSSCDMGDCRALEHLQVKGVCK